MSEKETPETIEEQNQEEALDSQADVPEEIQASAEDVEEKSIPEAPAEKKGLMERRPSFAQSSVPNAHKGYSGTPPIIMLLIISVFFLLSIIFGTAAIGN